MVWRLLAFSFLTLCPGLFSSACETDINPPSIVVRHGASLLANCSSSCNEAQGLGWEAEAGGISLTPGVSSLLLKIDKVELWELKPMCYTGGQDQLTKDLHVTVYQMPDSVSMSPVSSEMVEGQKYPIECHIKNVAPLGNLSVFWHKGNEILQTKTFNATSPGPQNVSSNVTLTAKRADNENEIWCEAKLNLWPDEQGPPPKKSELRRMNILYPPAFMESANETVKVAASRNATLNCTATGNPMPTYKWNFLNSVQEKISNQQMNESILTLSFHLEGNYSCTASNSRGSSTKYFTVIKTEEDRTTFIAILTSLVLAGLLLFIGGLYFVKHDGTFSCRSPSGVI